MADPAEKPDTSGLDPKVEGPKVEAPKRRVAKKKASKALPPEEFWIRVLPSLISRQGMAALGTGAMKAYQDKSNVKRLYEAYRTMVDLTYELIDEGEL